MVRVLWQCPDFVIVNKDAGVDFHNSDGEAGLFHQVKKQLALTTLYPVHRLDKVTSGLLVLARTADANRELCRQFAGGEVTKTYLALSHKKPVKKQGAVVGDMLPGRRGGWKLTRDTLNPARTAFISHSLAPGVRLFMVKPLTGKTHQIRVALKSMGAPILGDALYAGAPADRTYLHAWQLCFRWQGKTCRFAVAPDSGEHFLTRECRQLIENLPEPEQVKWPRA